MEQILLKERKRSSLNPHDLGAFLYGKSYYTDMKRHLQKGPTLDYTPNIYNKSRVELFKDAYRYLPLIYNYNRQNAQEGLHYDHLYGYGYLSNPHQMPGGVHFGMFVKYIELMGSQEHKKLYFDKAARCQITGCYAQTEVGHGSDIRSLQTTSTYDPTTKQWIVNSPTASSAKYWPGEISFFANHAIVFAQTFIKGKNHGVNPFLVPIKNQDYQWLPGVEGGDIGPKIGFHAKQNGYLYFRNVRVPKNNLFTKYVEVSDEGQLNRVGDPRIGYGTMMFIRQLISNSAPKVFAQAIIIATRYSFFRKQGVGHNKQEMNILEYQTQQQKVLTRIAQYYALSIASAKIRQVSAQNGQRVLKSDFSLLKENHSNLAFSKCLFSQISQDGIEILRRSMGGHGTSYFSGVPQLMNEYAANNTHEGQNTVMYLQTALYVLKSYLNNLTKGKKLSDSVKYIARFQQLSDIQFAGNKPWTLEELRDVLLKSLSYLIQLVGGRMAGKQSGQTQKDIINSKVGIRLQQLAQLHGVYFIMNQFVEAIKRQGNHQIKLLMNHVCKLFAISQIQRLSEPIIEGGFICPRKWSLISAQKQVLLKEIRPHTAVLLDSFGIPDKYLRSEVASGNPYQNYLNKARECEINTSVTKSALQIGSIKEVLAKPKL